MRILFFPVRCTPFHGKTLEERPLGGTETAVIRLAEALDLCGHDVTVATSLKTFPESKPRYVTMQDALRLGSLDVVIGVRGIQSLNQSFETKKLFYWTGDSWDNVNSYGIGDPRYINKLDGLFVVSQWHANTMCASSGFPLEKTFVLRNGIRLAYFAGVEPRVRKRLIYSSTPNRGLRFLPSIFSKIKKKHSDAELHVYSSTLLYCEKWKSKVVESPEYKLMFEELHHEPGCFDHGSIRQSLLAREFMKSSLWTYPTDFEETGCITAMEAQAGGCVAVTTDLAALKEIVGDAGVLLNQMPGSDQYTDLFVEACDRLLSDDAAWARYSKIGLERAQAFDWHCRALELLKFLKERHGLA